ncbi:MAG TPA: DUF1972 domain-containing protein [Vicinamibacteria bacterium]|nr:DUF1972 domain-containing protein [Vicinamibacteria bacterium]
MKVAILGTRGIPASYGGFETFAEELSCRMAARGHEVTVYCRSHHTPKELRRFRDVRLVVLPTIRRKHTDTLVHTFLSSMHATTERFDVALVCNSANSIFVPLLKLSGAKVALNVDGLDWKRKKWRWAARSYYRLAEKAACHLADTIVTDAECVRQYYREVHGTPSVFIPYGAPTKPTRTVGALEQFGLQAGKYLLYVSRLEPENNAHLVIEAFGRLRTQHRLVIVGDAPYAASYKRKLRQIAGDRVVFTGYVFGRAYRELMSHADCYVHATEVGGTHPALLEAMGMGDGCLVSDTPENREVASDTVMYFSLASIDELASTMQTVLDRPEILQRLAERARARVREKYDWNHVTDAYEQLLEALLEKTSTIKVRGAGERLHEGVLASAARQVRDDRRHVGERSVSRQLESDVR